MENVSLDASGFDEIFNETREVFFLALQVWLLLVSSSHIPRGAKGRERYTKLDLFSRLLDLKGQQDKKKRASFSLPPKADVARSFEH